MILGHIYNIKPIISRFKTLLLSSEKYCQMIQFKQHQRTKEDEQYQCIKQDSLVKNNISLSYLWLRMENSLSVVCGDEFWSYIQFIRPHLLTNLAFKGDFSLYQNFIKTLSDTHFATWNDIWNEQHPLGFRGGFLEIMFSLITAFLRLDLADNYRYPGGHMYDTFHVLFCLLRPSLLIDIKKDLLKSMIPLSKKDLYNFDLYNNPRYHPRNRIKFLSKLVFSTTFTFSFLRKDINTHYDNNNYPQLREYIDQLYNQFDYFKKMWHLSEYCDLHDNEEAQREIHSDFRKSIQTLMCFCDFYFFDRRYSEPTRENGAIGCIETLKDYLTRNNINNIVSFEKNDKLFDIVPENEDQTDNLVDFLVRSDNDNENGDFYDNLKHSRRDVWFRDNGFVWRRFVINFDRVYDIKRLLRHVWQLSKQKV